MKFHFWLFILAILIGSGLVLSSARQETIIYDESAHIGAGYSYVKMQDMRLNPEHPPLVKLLAGLPLLGIEVDQDVFALKAWQIETNGQWDFGQALIFDATANPDRLVNKARLPMILFYIGTALIIFVWVKKIFGDSTALLASTVYILTPTVIAHARYVTTDVAAGFGAILFLWRWSEYLQIGSKRNLIWAILAMGIALLIKFSMILLVVLAVLSLIIKAYFETGLKWRPMLTGILKATGISVLAFVILVWPIYAVLTSNYPIEKQANDAQITMSNFPIGFLANASVWASSTPILRAPAHFVMGFLMAGQRVGGGNVIFFRDVVKNSAGPSYFPVVYFAKEPLIWWVMITISAILLLIYIVRHFRSLSLKPLIKNYIPIWLLVLWLVIYWLVSLQSLLNIGVRHLLPTYPAIIILVSAAVILLSKKYLIHVLGRRYDSIILGLILFIYLFITIQVYPFYLTFFNSAAGGAQGGSHIVTDSNLDWGQDLKRLAGWLDENNIERVELDYFGTARPDYYLSSRFEPLWATKYANESDYYALNSQGGWLAISMTFFREKTAPRKFLPSDGSYEWLANQTPIEIIGNSILVFDLRKITDSRERPAQ